MRGFALLALSLVLICAGCKETGNLVKSDSPEFKGSSSEYPEGTPEYIGGVPAAEAR